MEKPRIFLGSSGKQEKLLQALTRGLEDVVHVDPWTRRSIRGPPRWSACSSSRAKSTSRRSYSRATTGRLPVRRHLLPPGPVSRLRETTSSSRPDCSVVSSACAGPSSSTRAARSSRLISSASPACGSESTTAAETRVVVQKLRKAIESEARVARIEGLWWQFSLTQRGPHEPSAVSLIADLARPKRRARAERPRWQEDGSLSARYWSEAVKERKEPSGIFYYWKGERPRDPDAPQLDGTGEILMESADRATGYFTTRAENTRE